MSLKQKAIDELDGIMKDFNIRPSRLGRDLFNNPNFYTKLKQRNTKVTDETLDKIFRYAVELRGQGTLPIK